MAHGVSHQSQQLLRDSWLTSVSAPSPPTTSNSAALRNFAEKTAKQEKEIIHSGHFMVSHFEAEAQDDEDTELPMPDLDESSGISELNTCTDVALLPTNQINQSIVTSNTKTSSNAVIDVSLAKLFKCMSLAYRQKLTSPKWNSFKGIRLRWKDKIRLNNLIWRCWHMQFIMKKKTLVCQFASPLDVDLHSKPESVVLEGKYWKRQFGVIKAEYMKWRKFYRNRGLDNNAILDTMSEIDIFDWSPQTSDNNLMSIDDYCWTADTLFSTINSTPFPFPDPREIAKAGIADFIQPSLGPLQPNLDDFMSGIPLQELINNHLSTRLPPVPEEGTDDTVYRTDVYDFPALMDSEPMDSSMMAQAAITDVTDVNLSTKQQVSDPLICATNTNSMQPAQTTSVNMMSFDTTNQSVMLPFSNKMYETQTMQQEPVLAQSLNQISMDRTGGGVSSQQQQIQSQTMLNQNTSFLSPSTSPLTIQSQNADFSNLTGAKKRPVKGLRSQLFGRREPHNYDKTTPTQHQTNLYNQMIAQQNRNQLQQMQQQQQQQQMQQLSGVTGTTMFNSTNYLGAQNVQSPMQATPPNTYNTNALNLTASNTFNAQTSQMASNMLNMSPQMQTPQQTQSQPASKPSFNLLSLLSVKSPVTKSTEVDTNQMDTSYKSASGSQSSAYKPYTLQPSMKSSSYHQIPQRIQPTMPSNPSTHQLNQQQFAANALMDKELFRSKSLPMNSTLQALPIRSDEAFAVPKYQASKSTSNRNRARSNSMITKQQHHSSTTSLQSATSEPMLKTLAQLLTSKSKGSPNTSATPLSSSLSPGSSGESIQRRVGHIHAEQKRRYNIKNGFDMLHTLIPQLQQNPNAKLSKAAMLQKGAEYIKQLRSERDAVKQKMDVLRKERDALNNSLNFACQRGASFTSTYQPRMYTEYVREKTLQNWKFWILGLIFEPLLNSYNTTVSVASMEELYRSAMIWVDQHCSLVEIRPAVSDKLRYLSTTTDLLSDPPSTLQEEVIKAISSSNVGSSTSLL